MTDKATELKVKIRALQMLSGIKNPEMAKYLHMSERSYQRRLQDIGNMKLKDILKLEKVLHTNFINAEGVK